MTEVIDGHAHVWVLDPERYPWHQTLASVPIPQRAASAEELLGHMDAAGIDRTLLLQPSVYGFDNSYLCDAADRYPDRFVAVCVVNPHAPGAGDDLRYWCRERGCCGVRVNLIEDGTADWLAAPDQQGLWEAAGELGIPVSLQMRPDHATGVRQLARAYPAIRFIADYLGREAAHDGTGAAALRLLSEEQNICTKLLAAGQDSDEGYPFRDLWPLYQAAVDAFGASRVMFGSEFPHVLAHCRYRDATQLLSTLPFLDERDRKLIGAGTALEIYRFDRS
ncbi:MAG TPA: amidohydrolase family protein [Streptosporangiaceae bacterium]|jgi:predicted TIM-barrel fold metal-dependent hydrolase